MTLACEGSATQTLEATRCGSFDFARRLASLRMTLHSVIAADQVQDSRVSRSGRLATDQKAVRRRGPGRVVLGSKPQLATTKENSCAGPGTQLKPAACDYIKTRRLGWSRACQRTRALGWSRAISLRVTWRPQPGTM